MFAFLGTVAVITLSGALAPGPVTAFAVARGSRDPHAGVWLTLGHMVVESLVVACVFLGAGQLAERAGVRAVIGAAGAVMMLWMGLSMLAGFLRGLRSARRSAAETPEDTAPAEDPEGGRGRARTMLGGLGLSIANPYFLVWWATVGAALAMESRPFGWLGIALFLVVHWSVDLGWCWAVSWAAWRGRDSFGAAFERGVLLVCGLMLLYMSGRFALGAGRLLLA